MTSKESPSDDCSELPHIVDYESMAYAPFFLEKSYNPLQVLRNGIIRSISESRLCKYSSYPTTPEHWSEKKIHEITAHGKSVTFTDYSPVIFSKLRAMLGIDELRYCNELNLSDWEFEKSNGRSSAKFVKFKSKEWVLKTVKRVELNRLLEILPRYFSHLEDNPQSLLVHFVGAYEMKGFLDCIILIMPSIVNWKSVKDWKLYDLKGSLVNRRQISKESPVFLDQDFLESKSNVNISEASEMLHQLQMDAAFLDKNQLMDYSLLLLIARNESWGSFFREKCRFGSKKTLATAKLRLKDGVVSRDGKTVYFLGIIDILQAYNITKKSERLKNLVAHGRRANEASCINPSSYRQRFVDFLLEHVITCPTPRDSKTDSSSRKEMDAGEKE